MKNTLLTILLKHNTMQKLTTPNHSHLRELSKQRATLPHMPTPLVMAEKTAKNIHISAASSKPSEFCFGLAMILMF